MKLGLSFANAGPAAEPAHATAIARKAEEVGFDSLWTVEHVVVPAGYESEYPYNRSGKMAGGEDAAIPDPLVWLAYVAAVTQRIHLATGILILPQRSPLYTAKEVATLDVLSGGRVILGVGIGWLREEFEALRVPFEGRGRRTDEYVAALRTLWAEDNPTFSGEHVAFSDARMWPKPVRRSVPIVVGGHADSSARRAGRIGDGYFPGRAGADDLERLVGIARQSAEEAGRDPRALEITAGGRPTPENIERLASLGVSRLIVPPAGFETSAVLEGLEQVAQALRSAGVAG